MKVFPLSIYHPPVIVPPTIPTQQRLDQFATQDRKLSTHTKSLLSGTGLAALCSRAKLFTEPKIYTVHESPIQIQLIKELKVEEDFLNGIPKNLLSPILKTIKHLKTEAEKNLFIQLLVTYKKNKISLSDLEIIIKCLSEYSREIPNKEDLLQDILSVKSNTSQLSALLLEIEIFYALMKCPWTSNEKLRTSLFNQEIDASFTIDNQMFIIEAKLSVISSQKQKENLVRIAKRKSAIFFYIKRNGQNLFENGMNLEYFKELLKLDNAEIFLKIASEIHQQISNKIKKTDQKYPIHHNFKKETELSIEKKQYRIARSRLSHREFRDDMPILASQIINLTHVERLKIWQWVADTTHESDKRFLILMERIHEYLELENKNIDLLNSFLDQIEIEENHYLSESQWEIEFT